MVTVAMKQQTVSKGGSVTCLSKYMIQFNLTISGLASQKHISGMRKIDITIIIIIIYNLLITLGIKGQATSF